MDRSCFNLMLKRLEGVWFALFLLLSVAHAQDGTLRQWQAVRYLEPSLVSKQLPVYLDGTIAFSEPERSFFILGDSHEGIPVHVMGPFPDIKAGDRMHIEGTTMRLLQQPGVRLVTWKKLAHSGEGATDRASVSYFTPTDPFFKKVQVEGLVTSVAQGTGELLIGINRTAAESYLLRIPDRVWKDLPQRQVVGDWVKVNGFYLPADPRATHQSARNSFAITSQEDILLHQDLVQSPSLNYESLADRLDSDTPKAVMVEGKLNQLDAYQWALKLAGGEIMLDWAENTDLSGRRSRCVGFPISRSGQIVLKPSMVFLEKIETEPDAAESAAKTVWEFRSSEYLEPLTTIAEVVALDDEAAKRNRPVDLEVTVTYHHPTDYLFFVQDQTDAIYVTTDNTSVKWLVGGTKIRLMGNTIQGFFKHNIQDAEYEILEEGAFPEPKFCDLESLETGDFDARYVVTSGQVREAVRVGNGAQLRIQTRTGSFRVIMRDLGASKDPSLWVDTVVNLTGVAAFQYENQKPVGVILFVEDESHVEVIRSRPYDVMPPDTVSIDRSALANTPVGETVRVRLNGFLTGKNYSGTWTFQTEEQGFLIMPASVESSLKAGDFLQVIGWPRLTEEGIVIEEAQVALAEAEFELAPLIENDVSELNVDHLHRLISRQGRLIQATSNASRLNFMIQSSSERFACSLDISDTPGLTSSSFALGSVVRVEGILNSVPRDASIGEVPSLIVRHKKDIVLVSPPNWWTPRRILMALGVTGLVGLAAVTWSFVLRRKVQQQTFHIREMVVKERQAEEKYHNLFESALDLIFITDTQGRFVAANESCLDFFGVDLKTIQGKTIIKWVAPSDEAKVEKAFGIGSVDGSAAGVDGQILEVELRHRDGRFAFMELSIRGLALQEGIFGYQAIARNVDARKQSEMELVQSRDSYREAHQAKMDFLTMMSHDLRTPMNGVLGMTQLLLQSNLDKEQLEQVRTISSASDGVLKLMLDMLDMSRIETSQLAISQEKTDLIAMVEEVVTTVVAEADRKRLDLVTIHPPYRCPDVLADSARIKQVLLNLVTSAIKLTEQGGIAIRLNGQDQPDGHCLVRFEVEDSGISLQGGDREYLFELLTKTGAEEPRRFGGAGLALTLSKRIVQAMGGVIGADSHSDRGAVFWFELPIRKVESLKVSSHNNETPIELSERALLVSDSRFVKAYFEERGRPVQLEVEAISVEDFKEELRGAKPWKGIPFQTLLLDCRHLSSDLLRSLLDLADTSWKNGIRWGLVDTMNRGGDDLSTLPLDPEPFRIAGPLTGPAFKRFLNFSTKANGEKRFPDDIPPARKSSGQDKEFLEKERLKVLVVEDDSFNQKLMSIYLKKAGCDATVVSDGAAALQMLESNPFDVVLMDCRMAGMDGMEATRRIRADKKYDDLIIIATTANAQKGFREKCLEAGMNDFLVKPLKLDLLTTKLARIAQR